MAIIDSKIVFGENVELAAADLELPEVIDLAAYEVSGARDAIARGEPVWWVTLVNDRGTGGTGVRFDLQYVEETGGAVGTLVRGRTFAASEMFSGMHYVSSLPVTNIVTPHALQVAAYPNGTFSGTRLTSYLTASPPVFSNDNHIDWR